MSPGTFALLVGLFVIPVGLLTLGHRLRRRPPVQRAIFWGGLVGYLLGSLAAMWVGMVPAAEWAGSDTVRGLLGYWGLILGPVAGATAALAFRKGGHSRSVHGRGETRG
jgi:hypothetical protein